MKFFCAAFLASVSALAAAEPSGWAPNVAITATWNSNATNADRGFDEISALLLQAEVDIFPTRIPLGHDDALFLSGGVALEAWPRFDGLDRVTFGPRVGWQHKFGLGALAPVLRFEVSVDVVDARDEERSGLAGSGRLLWRQRLDEATQITISYERIRHHARDELYNQTAGEAAAEISRELDEHWSVAAKAKWRQGDVLSYASPPRPDLVALARDRDTVDVFGKPLIAYSLDARSLGGSLALTRSLDERTALSFAYEVRVTERSPLRYVNHLVSAAINRQF
ncbi:MAG: hypothetical protein JWM35_81 [Verrucomicrobia bacterium]|nr:hypothetical protein [Verrucomicrobiota bacterium]